MEAALQLIGQQAPQETAEAILVAKQQVAEGGGSSGPGSNGSGPSEASQQNAPPDSVPSEAP